MRFKFMFFVMSLISRLRTGILIHLAKVIFLKKSQFVHFDFFLGGRDFTCFVLVPFWGGGWRRCDNSGACAAAAASSAVQKDKSPYVYPKTLGVR